MSRNGSVRVAAADLRRFFWAYLALSVFAFAAAAGPRDHITPNSERELDARIAYFQNEAKSACDIHDRVCALGKRTLLKSAVYLAEKHPDCEREADRAGCEKRKAIRANAATAKYNEMVVASISADGPILFEGLYKNSEHAPEDVVAAYAMRTEADIAASSCARTLKVCVVGELAYLAEVDQLIRNEAVACEALAAGEHGSIQARDACAFHIGKQMAVIDALSRKSLGRITKVFGWPDDVHWGADASLDAWLLAQHADKDEVLQVRLFELIKTAFTKGLVPAQNYALIADRVAVHQAKPQLYGTQGVCKGEGSARHWEPEAIEGEARLDERRGAAGMEPYASYRKSSDDMCRGAAVARAEVAGQPSAQSVSAESELRAAIDILKTYHLDRAKVGWPSVEKIAFAMTENAKTPADTYPAIWYVIKQLGEKHTSLLTPDFVQAVDTGHQVGSAMPPTFDLPEGLRLQGGIQYLRVPHFWGTADQARAYVAALRLQLTDAKTRNICRFLVDLRGNTGGNAYPMINGLKGLLGPTPWGFWQPADRPLMPWDIPDWPSGADAGKPAPYAEPVSALDRTTVAVLLDHQTSSAGEMTAIGFEGRTKTRFFGEPTANYVTGNQGYKLPDGAMLLVTTAWDYDRLRRPYRDAIRPDEATAAGQPTVDAAVRWLERQPCD